MKKSFFRAGVLLTLCFYAWSATAVVADCQAGLKTELRSGQALIYYLYHSGWAVKTENHLLVFDYWQEKLPPAGTALATGWIDPAEVAGQNLLVFVSHGHEDHFDPRILSWKDKVKKITYIFGWPVQDVPGAVCFGSTRETRQIDSVQVSNIHHEFDQIPESAFLVKVDGLNIIHSGDHGASTGPAHELFKDNIDYLARRSGPVDLLFLPVFGGFDYAVEKLAPRFVFPMHMGGMEHKLLDDARKISARGYKGVVCVAGYSGQCFFYDRVVQH